METVTRISDRKVVSGVPSTSSPPEAARTLAATATYLLSEDGRKASLLDGGDGRAVQNVVVHVAPHRLHLVSVDREGVARLRLRPRFELDPEQRVVRIDSPPTYNAPPSIDELYRAAACNHELEQAYHAARVAATEQRHESERDARQQAAEAFLADKNARALIHPPPTSKICFLMTARGRLRFDVAREIGLAMEVPPEAHRRFRADQRAREERNCASRAEQLALHEEKKRFIAEWIAEHGSDEQKQRQAVGMLPMAEAVDAITNQKFAVLKSYAAHVHDGLERLSSARPVHPAQTVPPLRPQDIRVDSEHAQMATRAQFAMVRDIQASLPEASVHLRRHRLSLRNHQSVRSVIVYGVLVTMKVGPLMLRREVAAPDA